MELPYWLKRKHSWEDFSKRMQKDKSKREKKLGKKLTTDEWYKDWCERNKVDRR